jgi:hypothetical protein
MTRGEFEEVPAVSSGKRCGVQWAPWMGDWFTSWSPRNSNSNAEGQWDHWVDLAINILQSRLTEIVRPEAHDVAKQLAAIGFYTETGRTLTEDELEQHFVKPATREGQ